MRNVRVGSTRDTHALRRRRKAKARQLVPRYVRVFVLWAKPNVTRIGGGPSAAALGSAAPGESDIE